MVLSTVVVLSALVVLEAASSPLDFASPRKPVSTSGDAFNISSAFGSGMVLQMEPARAMVWGSDVAGNTVNVTLDGSVSLSGVADSSGVWRVQLAAMPPGGPHTLSAASSGGGALTLEDVYFGSVYICGGQSSAWSRARPTRTPANPRHANR